MRILVVSDTHGWVSPAIEVFERLQEDNPVDCIVHLGDLVSDARALQMRLGVEVLFVRGNSDGYCAGEDHRVMETEYGKILLTHGHLENVKCTTQNVLYCAEELGCKAVFFGHTHEPCFEEVNGIYLLNPGSISIPHGGGEGTYAVATITERELSATILFRNPTPPKIQGGVLKDMLNNSDRF